MRSLTRWIWDWTKTIVVALAIWFTFSTFILQAFRIPSSSMEGTLLIGDVLYVNKMLYGAEVPLLGKHLPAFREPRRGDILVFDSVEEEGLKVVKRLIGVSGDTLAMRAGTLIRNGQPVDEPWVLSGNRHMEPDVVGAAKMRAWQLPRLILPDSAAYAPDPNNWGPIVVPPDSFFMMGDNRRESYDSRFWGFLPRRNVRGQPLIIYYSYDAETYKPLPFVTNIRWGRLFSHPH
jgi:signal peptidase I